MIQGNEYLKNDKSYSHLLKPVKNPETKNENSEESNLVIKNNQKKIQDLFKHTDIKTSDTVPSDIILLYTEDHSQEETVVETENNNESDTQTDIQNNPEENKDFKRETAYKAIDKTQKVIDVASTIAKLTNQEGFDDLINSSSGVLSASKALIELDNANKSENKTKKVMSSLSDVANGVGTVLDVIDIPEAEFVKFTGKVLGLGAEQQALTEKIEKKDVRGIAGSSVSMVKGAWGTVVSGLEVAKLATSFGHKSGMVGIETVSKVTNMSTKISKFADKVAIPFAVAGSALNVWDLKNTYDKLDSKKQELVKLREENLEIPEVIRLPKTSEEEKLEKEIDTATTNMTFRTISASTSLISTTSLIVSVAYPPASSVTKVITIGGSIISSVTGTLSNEKKRESIYNAYSDIKGKYNEVLSKIDNVVFSLKK